ncbi:nucleotidyltransferase substrate binding protein [Dyadobacter subterraneus]|uniref:nucleotidyltransferase substrate binding protein n=1 Tax=Dyadobacter subterraneus TaxID=2773304 RepID=UPI0021D0BD1A|nr:nucleotidyltransferase substrate binding protein [Dyadobacter subterraneus]
MGKDDIRWQQRFKNFGKAIALLQEAVNLTKERSLTELEEQGLIQRFEFTHELAWNVLKDYFEDQGNTLSQDRGMLRGKPLINHLLKMEKVGWK